MFMTFFSFFGLKFVNKEEILHIDNTCNLYLLIFKFMV